MCSKNIDEFYSPEHKEIGGLLHLLGDGTTHKAQRGYLFPISLISFKETLEMNPETSIQWLN